jgi:hypothetical protein
MNPRSRAPLLAAIVLVAFTGLSLASVFVARALLGLGISSALGLYLALAVGAGWLSVMLADAHVADSPGESDAVWPVGSIRWGLVPVSLGFLLVGLLPQALGSDRLGTAQAVVAATGVLGLLGAIAVGRQQWQGAGDRLVGRIARFAADEEVPSDWVLPASRGNPPAGERWLALGAIALAGIACFLLASGGPLGHDESVYAVKGRSWVEGTPDSGFGLYRPIGMAVLARAVIAFSQEELAFRLVGASLAVFAVVIVLLVGRALFSPLAGSVGILLVAGAPSFLRRAPEFLNDIVTTGLVLTILLLLWHHFEVPGVGQWWVVMAAPVGALAFYLRYGAVTALLAVAAIGGLLWRRKLVASWKPLAATTGLLGLLIVPHLRYALATTGSVTGILSISSAAAGREALGEGLLTYLEWLPSRLAGPVAGSVMILGLLAASILGIRRLRGNALERRHRAALLVAGVAVAHLVVSGLFVHAEERYVFLSSFLLVLLGVQAAVDAAGRLATAPRRGGLAVGLVVVLTALLVYVPRAEENHRSLAESRAVVVGAGETIVDLTQDECRVVTSYVPQITWYSRCATVGFDLASAEPVAALRADLVLTFERGKRQPEPEVLARYEAEGVLEVVGYVADPVDRIGDATIFEVAR